MSERELRELHWLCKQKLEQLKKEDIVPDPIWDYQDIVELNYLCYETEKQAEDERQSVQDNLLDKNVKIGKITLRPWTIGVSIWVEDVACEIFKDDPYNLQLATIWALAHANEKHILKLNWDKKELKKEIRQWCRQLNIKNKDIQKVTESLLPQQKDDIWEIEGVDEQTCESNYSPIVTRLVSEFGKDADHWVWECAGDVAIGHLDDWNYWRKQEYEAEMEAAGTDAKKGKVSQITPSDIARNKVIKKTMILKDKIIKRNG